MTTEGFRATTGFPGGLFPTCGRQTPLYHGSVFGELSGSAELAEERTAELAERPASMQARIL